MTLRQENLGTPSAWSTTYSMPTTWGHPSSAADSHGTGMANSNRKRNASQ